MALSPQKFLDTVYVWAIKRLDPEKREQWEAEMDAPLPWQINKAPSQEQIEEEGQDFMNFMNQINAQR